MHLVLCILGLLPSLCLGGLLPRASNAVPTNGLNEREVNLTVIPPWGPSDLDFTLQQDTSKRLNVKEVWMGTVNVLAQVALKHRNQFMQFPEERFQDIGSNLVIYVKPTMVTSMPRQYVLWAMAQIINRLAFLQQFRASTFRFTWHGRPIGNIVLVNRGSEPPSANSDGTMDLGDQNSTNPMAHSNTTILQLASNENAIVPEFHFFGRDFGLKKAMMPAIGALIQAADLEPNRRINSWTGGMPAYELRHRWFSVVQPSLFTKEMLVAAIRSSAEEAMANLDFRQLLVQLKGGGKLIAEGGCTLQGQSGSVATESDTQNVATA